MRVVFVPTGFRFSAHIDEGIESALRTDGHEVQSLCPGCLRIIGQGALARVEADFLLAIHGRRFPHDLLRDLHCPSAIWLLDEPHEIDLTESRGRQFDIVLTNDRNTCGVHGPHKSWYLPLGADARVHHPRANGSEETDVSFIGAMLPERQEFLDRTYRLTSDFTWRIIGPTQSRQPTSFDAIWNPRSINHAEYIKLNQKSRIILDIPRDELKSFAGRTNKRGIPATGVSPRLFEVTGCGRFLLTSDARLDTSSFFPNGMVGFYRHGDPVDLAAQIRYWLDHEEEREEAAEAAADHCRKHHLYTHRVSQLVDIVSQWKATAGTTVRKRK